MIYLTGNPVNDIEFKDIKKYTEPTKNSSKTPEMAAVNKINQQNKEKIKNKVYSAIKDETKPAVVVVPEKKSKKIDDSKIVSLASNVVSPDQFKSISRYKEPKNTNKNTPEMARLKKMPKPRTRKLILIKETKSIPVPKIRPKIRPVVPSSKKIQVL